MRRAVAFLLLGLVPPGCGERPPPLPDTSKTMPVLAQTWQGRTLEGWRAVADDAPATERAAKAWALAALAPDPLAATPSLERMLGDEEPSVRLAALVAVERLAPPAPDMARRVAAHLESSETTIRRQARLALRAMGAAAMPALEEALTHPEVRVRWGAVWALGGVGEAAGRAVPAVASLARRDPHPTVRRQARLSLARMGPEGVAACAAFLAHEDPAVRAEAAAALSVGGPGVAETMATLLGTDDEDTAARAAGVLADLGAAARPVMDVLLRALRRAGPVRFNAAEALIAIGEPAHPALRDLLRSEDPGLAGIARYILEGGTRGGR